jgi:hypothetical protein
VGLLVEYIPIVRGRTVVFNNIVDFGTLRVYPAMIDEILTGLITPGISYIVPGYEITNTITLDHAAGGPKD